MPKLKKAFPDFTTMSRDEEAAFWETIDIEEYFDLDDPETVRLSYKPDTVISFKIGSGDEVQLRQLAEQKGIGHTTLLRLLLRYYLAHHDEINLT